MSIDPRYYVHDADKAALEALKQIPVFPQFLKGFMKVWSERQFRLINLSSSIRINENQMAGIYEMLPPICERLGIPVPELYLQRNPNPNSYTSGDTDPFIVITSGLIEVLPRELIPTVLAHECGHIACRHVLYRTMGGILLGGAASKLNTSLPFGNLITVPLEVAFFHWMRCSEYSADRAAVICDGSAEKMSEVCLRLAGYDKDNPENMNREEFLKQGREYKELVKDSKWNKTLEYLMFSRLSHPLSAVRALECEEWGASGRFRRIMSGDLPELRTNPLQEKSPSEGGADSQTREGGLEGAFRDLRQKLTDNLPKLDLLQFTKHDDEEQGKR